MSIICDCCGRKMEDNWKIEGMQGVGGNCTDCGDNLCAECAGAWNEDGVCKLCAMSIEELEYNLPLTVQRSEKKKMPCDNCERVCMKTITYEQRIYRNDDYGYDGKNKKRTYEIYFTNSGYGEKLFTTGRFHSFRVVLIKAHKVLTQMGLIKMGDG